MIIIADIYAAREKDNGTINAQQLADEITRHNKNALYCGNFEQITSYLNAHCQKGDLLLTVGAGDIYRVGEMFLNE